MTSPSRTSVLIIGSGSAGIFAATWLSIYGIPYKMLERRPGPMEIGQADGVQCRTVEIYESFGVSEELLRESWHVLEVAFWGPKETEEAEGLRKGGGGIERKSRAADREQGLSHMPHVILNQARMNSIMLGVIDREKRKREERTGEKVEQGIEYGVEVKSISISPSSNSNTATSKGDSKEDDSFPISVTAEKDGQEVEYEAKYLLGCDGAHSTVRKNLGYKMLGDTTDTVWGVMDIYPLTSFPDIRRKCTIHSSSGNLLIIPREGGELVRFYIQLPPGTRAKEVQLADLQNTARRIFAPYSMEFAGTFWWSAYSIGQRLADGFEKDGRAFLTGDACHTHSPKAGQGMNVSLQDGYNIGWKLGQVLSGISDPSLLDTYVLERSKTAADLIAFDREFARMFSEKEKEEGEFARYFVKSGRYTAGLTARYEDSALTDAEGSSGVIAAGVTVGMRFPSAQVVRFCDCKALPLLRVLRSDGRWRIVVFGGDVNVEADKMRLDKLATSLESLSRRLTPPSDDPDSLIEPLLVLSSKFVEVEQEQVPDYFWPATGKWKIRDLHKVYVDDEHYNDGHGHAYEKYGVDARNGAVVIVRPDQYVAKITTLDDFAGIESFFDGFIIGNRHDR